MKRSACCAAALLSISLQSMACEVDTAAAVRDQTHGNFVIPVRVKPGERCVILDHLSEEGRRTRMNLWVPVEKMGNSTPRLGRWKREYEVDGDIAKVDRFVYLAGHKAGEDSVVFSSSHGGKERRAVEYRIGIE
ncbi:hypothetical protein K8U54_20920 [Pseudomonas fulva]|uniref:hypothetical protein n=1 Tax=Pseudomonas fulva TaxID=47880 RepID=UPI00201E0948|nr:hypothetical protein [Pseudomonas fulva]UQY34144.1 hypothetical protein K8U54_20920 [Pseudomonas fulva]